MRPFTKQEKGFTLIELLVVISIIALLLSIVMPGLNMAKRKAASIVCLTNVKNMSLGWFSYKEDNNDWIMSAAMNGTTYKGNEIPGWINVPEDENEIALSNQSSTPVTDEDEIRGIEKGALHPYLKSPDVFNCPADKVKSYFDGGEKFVTYSMARCLAGVNLNPAPADALVFKYSEITSPGTRYNFIESAQERNFISMGWFSFGSPEWRGGAPSVWWDTIAVNHGDSSVLGFCDGHAENRKWQESNTKIRCEQLASTNGAGYGRDTTSGHDASNDQDLAYMQKGWAYRYK